MEELLKTLIEGFRLLIREEIAAALAEHGNGKPAPLEVNGKEAARLLNLPLSWVMSAARTGKLKCVRHGHHVRFSMADLNDFIQRRNGDSDVVSD